MPTLDDYRDAIRDRERFAGDPGTVLRRLAARVPMDLAGFAPDEARSEADDLRIEQHVLAAQSVERDDETDELLLTGLVGSPARFSGRCRVLLVGSVAVVAAALTAAGIVIAPSLGSSGSGEPAATAGWSTAPVTANPSWRCVNGQVPVSSYQVVVAGGEPTQVESITESCASYFRPESPPSGAATSQIFAAGAVSVTVEPAGGYIPDTDRSSWQTVPVNGTTGYYTAGSYRPSGGDSVDGSPSTLYWAYAKDSYVVITSPSISPQGIPASTLIAVAQSGIWRGRLATLPLRLHTLPTDYETLAVTSYATTGTTVDRIADLFLYKPSGETLDIALDPRPFRQYENETSNGTITTVDGHKAVITSDPTTTLAVQLDSATLVLGNITTAKPADAATLTHVAAGITVVPEIADTSRWYSVTTAIPSAH